MLFSNLIQKNGVRRKCFNIMKEKINLVTILFILSITFCPGQEAIIAPLTLLGANCVLPSRAVPKNCYQEPFRPQIRFSSEQDFLADPNGLVFLEGEYHMMYHLNLNFL